MYPFRTIPKTQAIRPQNPYVSNLNCGVCLQNTYDYSPFGVGGKVCGAITDKIIGNKELLKSGTNGFINEKLSDLEEKKTMDKQD